MKKYWKEIKYPKRDKEYWTVYNPEDDLIHFFETQKDAEEYASWNFIEDQNILKECFN